MSDIQGAEGGFSFGIPIGTKDIPSRVIRSHRFYYYQLALYLLDSATLLIAFLSSAFFAGMAGSFQTSWREILLALLPGIILLAFFPGFRLYSYHDIFLLRRHLIMLTRAFCWGLFSVALVYFLYGGSKALLKNFVVAAMMIPALALLFVGRRRWSQMIDFVQALGLAFISCGVLAVVAGDGVPGFFSRSFFVPSGFFIAAAILFPLRTILVQIVFNRWLRRRFRRQTLIVGTDEEARRFTSHLVENNAPFWVAGFLGSREEPLDGLPVVKSRLGDLRDLPRVIGEVGVEELVVTDEQMEKRVLIAVLDYCTSAGVNVWFPPRLMPIIDIKLRIDRFCGLPMIRLCSQKKSRIYDRVKAVLEKIIVLPVFVIQLPLFLVIAAAIKLTSPGPVFYRARAIGEGGREFVMYKFRSMRTDADTSIHREYVSKLIKGEIEKKSEDQVLKITDDPRVTPVGRIIRKLSLDELPQLLNVLKGEMSLVGPRPCLPYEYELYKEWHKKRQSIRPGITGLWQVTGRSEVVFEDMVLLDLYYIYNRSLMMDLNIIIETAFVLLEKKGAF
jgi:undecaprenyl-phosphate galactose phosphotransferase